MDPKQLVGKEIASRVENGSIIGIGTGSTVDAAIDEISKRIKSEGIAVYGVPTSYESSIRASEGGIKVLDPISVSEIEWAFDGADAVDSKLRCIKGRGGALLREKLVAARSKHFIVIVDSSKMVGNIAEKIAVPIQIIPESRSHVEKQLNKLGATSVTKREASGKYGAVITESGGMILDASFKEISDDLEAKIKQITGVVESGLFLTQASEVLVAEASGIKMLKRS